MADHKLSNTVRNASAVNLKYSADLLNLAREYVRAFGAALTTTGTETETKAPATDAPLLLAGRAGETANAAFALSSSRKLTGTVTLRVTGSFEDSEVRVEPEQISFGENGEKIVRILAKVGKKMRADTDFVGAVVISDLDHRITQFILRKLAD
jgi:hypothetical protein